MKTWLLLGVVVGSTVIADLLQSTEMKRHGEIKEFHPRGLGRLLAALARICRAGHSGERRLHGPR